MKADVDAVEENGRSAAWMAVTEDGRSEYLRCLLDAGCDVNLADKREKRTPLQVD